MSVIDETTAGIKLRRTVRRPGSGAHLWRERLLGIASPVVLLILWEIAARAGLVDARFFPAPSSIGRSMLTMMKSGELENNTWATLHRLLLGFVAGGLPGLALGILMGVYRPIRLAIEPLIAATYPIPKSAILPLILLIFGLGEPSKIVMVAIGAFYPIAINTTAGVREINSIYFDVGKNFGAGRWNTFRTIALPGALPFIMTGAKLGAGLSLILIAIAEMMGAKKGLGYMIWSAWETFDVEQMYVGLFVIALIGFLITIVFDELERRIIPWKSTK
ncbi:putative taurine transport system permease protein [Paraburkholderia piptadeniae]|uniref:Taurine transport system permease protein n=1 Tax=Paraburkholderia piptadeniae TaxID=1701573 RepID=A0A1N7SPF8_9BURK|nr:ABC transporter permease [Paraburkholderia piptadeniae]SIT49303.1 putative taurine transport system permease protein [Paraburkholderia piptadeniae]